MSKIATMLFTGVVLASTAAAASPKLTTAQKVEKNVVSQGEPSTAVHRPFRADPERILAHVKLLAGAVLQGRGGDIAADYIAKQFSLYGLEPAGDNGTYFQAIPMVEVKTLGETSFHLVSTSLETMTLNNPDDLVANNESQTDSAYIDAPIVFVGYGINAPQFGWDDYKQAHLDGKVALVFANEPASDDAKFFNSKAGTYFGSWKYKFEETARQGAIATLIIHSADLTGDSWEVLRNAWGSRRYYLLNLDDGAPKLRAASWIQIKAAKKLAALAGLDLDRLFEQAHSRNFRPIELPLRLQAHVASQVRPFVSRNVLAVLSSEGAISQQAVLYTARYDELGIDPGVLGHHIDQRAVDNATSCGVLLEVARAWSQAPAVARRAILFAALTAEDQGLLGSRYLAKHSPVPPGKISVDLNYDTLPPVGSTQDVVVSSAERTTFYSTVEAEAKKQMLAIRPDPNHQASHYDRSSHFSLAQVGVPAFSISQATDEYPAAMDFAGDAKLALFGYELGIQAASKPELIAWLPGDQFEAERKLSQLPDQLRRKAPRSKTKARK
jgi:Zn-dependent M28 family amino/carboxypeptidase